jgi:guanylate kinase
MEGRLFVISAPSGGGKSTIVESLRHRITGVSYSVSHTSRSPRAGERDGEEYHFVDRETFQRMVDEGAFVEWAEVYGNLYGTSISSLTRQMASGADVLVDVDIQGGRSIRNQFEESVLIFLLPPSMETLEARLRRRKSEDEATLRERLKQAEKEMKNCRWYDYIVINDRLEEAVQAVEAIILSERQRTARQIPTIKKLFDI